MKQYPLAALDFIIDKKGEIYFLEANSFPGLFKEQLKFNIDELQKVFGKKLIILTSKETPPSKNFLETVKIFTETEICFKEDNDFNDYLINKNGKKILKGNLLCRYNKLKNRLSGKYKIINTEKISNITKDKFKTYKLLKKFGIQTPKTFPFKTKEQLEKIIKKENLKKITIKPRFGARGENIFFSDHRRFANLKLEKNDWIVQDKIEITKKNGNYWDIRTLVANGKYIGSIERNSKKPVVNICQGGTLKKIPKSLDQKIQPIAEKIVKIFEQV